MHNHKHTWMSSSYSSLDWFCHIRPISLCIDLFVFIYVYFVCFCLIQLCWRVIVYAPLISNGSVYLVNMRNCKLVSEDKFPKWLQVSTRRLSTFGRVGYKNLFWETKCNSVYPVLELRARKKWIIGYLFSFWKVCRQDKQPYPSGWLFNLVAGIQRFIREERQWLKLLQDVCAACKHVED